MVGMKSRKLISCISSLILVFGLYPTPAFANLGSASLEGASDQVGEVFELGSPVALELGDASSGFMLSANAADQDALAGATLSLQAGYDDVSGLASRTKPTVEQIKQMWKAIPAEPLGKSIFAKANDNDAYTAGTLTAEAQSFAESYLNFIRYSAGLDDVAFDNALNVNAAQGALILAKRNGGLTHTPETPTGVTDAQAKPGKYACATSNISYSASSSINYLSALRQAIQGQIDDSSESNIGTLGHRRWLLKPDTSTMGIGSAYVLDGFWHTMYSTVRVFNNPSSVYYDSSYGATSASNSTDYDFISWPASGNFANNVFTAGTPWSVTLNPNRYQTPSEADVTVTLTRVSDGAKWTLNSADAGGGTTDEYFKVETLGYGVSNCIIFNPGINNLNASDYQGEYRVDVTGLKTSSGSAASLSYRVNFFNAEEEDISKAVVTAEKSAYEYTGSAIEPPVKVILAGKQLPASAYTVSYENNTKVGVATVKVKGQYPYVGIASGTFSVNKASARLAFSSSTVTRTVAQGACTNKLTSKTDGAISYKSSNTAVAVVDAKGTVTPKKVGKATITASSSATSNYTAATASFAITVKAASISSANISGIVSKTYTGQGLLQSPIVKLGGKQLKVGTDYSLSYENNVNAGRATVIVKGKGNYTGSISKAFTIKQAANTMKVSGRKVTLKAKSLKKAAQSVTANKAYSVSKAKGKLSFKKGSGNKKIAVNTKNGKLTIKKGLTKGAYKVKVKVTAKGTANYAKLAKDVIVTVVVK